MAVCGALALFAAWPASALDPGRQLTQYLKRIWQTPQGLPQSGIFAIHQTHDGYLWLGTGDGLVRFDGVRFTSPAELDGITRLRQSYLAAEDRTQDLRDVQVKLIGRQKARSIGDCQKAQRSRTR